MYDLNENTYNKVPIILIKAKTVEPATHDDPNFNNIGKDTDEIPTW